MTPRIHITGASGSGTTTLGRALAAHLGLPHRDSDDYYWIPTTPLYTTKRAADERDAALDADLHRSQGWVWSGSAMSWRITATPTLCVFLTVPAEIRVERLRRRELGLGVPESSIGPFLEWAASYDAGTQGGRTRARHEAWLAEQRCPVLRIDGDRSTEERIAAVVQELRRT